MSVRRLGPAVLLLALPPALFASPAQDPVLWPEHQRAFFQDGPGLLLDAATRQRLEAASVEERDRFLTDFLRDPLPATETNELAVAIERRSRLVREELASPLDDRARLLFLHGRPLEREEIDCGAALVPIVIWDYGAEKGEVLFYEPPGRQAYRLWRPHEGKRVLYSSLMEGWFEELRAVGLERERIDVDRCRWVSRVDEVTRTRGLFDEAPDLDLERRIDALLSPPEDLAAWAAEAATTELPEPAKELRLGGLEVRFPYRDGQRVAARFVLSIDGAEGLATTGDGDDPRVELEVEGLLEHRGSIFESFKVRFEQPFPPEGSPVVLVWERRLRPGRDFVARLQVRDAVGGASARRVRVVSVPRSVERIADADGGRTGRVDEVAAAGLGGADSLALVQPVTDGLSKAWRAEALVTGQRIREVVFAVDGEEQLRRTRPPYTADLRLADVPLEQVVTASGFDADGSLVAEDRVLLNRARGLFEVRIVRPGPGDDSRGTVLVQAEVSVPQDARLEAVGFSVDESPVVTLSEPPWQTALEIDASGRVSYLTVVARLEDGTRAEDVVFLNAPENLERVDVGLVELFATVTDGAGRLIDGLAEEDFEILEKGSPRSISRFDQVDNLPLVVGFAIDASSSMGEHMAEARQAALGFLSSVLRPQDRAFAVAFSDSPRLVAPPTDDPDVVARALTEVHSSGWTTLYDAVVKSLFYFRGFPGRRALVLLSDGEDTSSRTSFAEALRYARESGVVVYSIGIGGNGLLRGKLKRFAADTGGRFFHVGEAGDLEAVYAEIERELRSQYFLTFAPGEGRADLSEVEVRTRDRSLQVRATRGYAP